MLDRYGIGSIVEVSIKQRRSNRHHRLFWVVCARIVESGATPFETTEQLVDALKMSCGLTEIRQGIGGAPYIVPASISFSSMDQGAFNAFTERAFAIIAAHYGIDVETQKVLARGDDV
jgi:hypothetical protein